MTCNEVRSRLIHLASRSGRDEALAGHLEGCAPCGAYAARLLRTVRALADHHAGIDPDAAFVARVVAALPEQSPMLARMALKLLPAALALVLVLAGWIAIEERRHTTTPEPVPSDDLLTWVLQDEGIGS